MLYPLSYGRSARARADTTVTVFRHAVIAHPARRPSHPWNPRPVPALPWADGATMFV